MNFKTLKTLALVGSAITAIGLVSPAMAADNDDMDASITTSTTITATAGAVMDFGSWLIGVPAASVNTSTIVMDPTDGSVAPTAGADHQLIQLAGATAFGTVTVTLPAGADGLTLQMSRAAVSATLGAGLALTDVSYYNPDTPAQTGAMAAATSYPITITTGLTGAAIQFGGTISATAPVTDGDHAETFDVAFAY